MANAKRGKTPDPGEEGAVDRLKLLKALAHPIRMDILGVLADRNVSASGFAKERSESTPKVAYHFRYLRKLGCIEATGKRPVRGSYETFYRRTRDIVFGADDWPQLPDDARRVVAASTLQGLVGRMTDAIQAGTFTARQDVHITWRPVTVDEQGWTEVAEILDSAEKAVAKAEKSAKKRLAKTGEDGLLATVAFAGFESPRPG